MPQMTVQGDVIRTRGDALGIRVQNERELRDFCATHQVDNDLGWFDGGAPVVSIGRQADIASCQPGDVASLTFDTEDRSNGKRGIRTVDFEVHAKHP